MDTLQRLFSGQSLGNKRMLLVVGAFVLLTGLARPLLRGPARAQPSASPTPTPAAATTTAPAVQTQPESVSHAPEKILSVLDLEPKGQPLFAPEPASTPSLGRMLVSLAAVLGLIVAAWFVFRRRLCGRMAPAGQKQLALVESTRVGSRQNLLLVQAGTRKYLLAATPEKITLVADVTEACGKNESPQA